MPSLSPEQQAKKVARERKRRENPEYRAAKQKRAQETGIGLWVSPRWIEMLGSAAAYFTLWQKMFTQQKGRCKICKRKMKDGESRFHMDHCHVTDRIRGLLCFSCNSKLGWYEKYRDEVEDYLA